MSYQDDNNWQHLTPELNAEYIKKASDKLDRDYNKLKQFAVENNIYVPIINPRGDKDYGEMVYYIAKKMWTADGYYDPPAIFKNIKQRERKFAKDFGI